MKRKLLASRVSRRLSLELFERRELLAGLVHASSLIYLGAFRVPDGTFGASTFQYGGAAMAFNPTNNSLFVVGHDWDQAVAEISIPALMTGSLSGLNTASVLQPFVRLIDKVPDNTLEDADTLKIGGMLVVGNQLVGTIYEYYDATGNAVDSHFKLNSLNLANATATGLFQVGNLGGGYVAGYMGPVASDWRDDFGVAYMTGLAGVNIISRSSVGPGVLGFDPAQLGAGTAPATPMVYYPLEYALADPGSQNSLFNMSSEVRGVVFPEGTDSVLFFGSHGTGPFWYGHDSENDPARVETTTHAPPYQYQVWAYDAHDLLDVKNGVKQPWEVQPYDVWALDVPYATGANYAGGATYDPTTGRIFVSEIGQDGGTLPVIHVYQATPSSPDTTAPAISSVASGGLTPSGATITWTTDETADTQVEYGLTTAYGDSTALNTSPARSHSVTISGLAANTLYHYRVKSRDAAGNLAASGDFTFTTAAADTTAPSIASVSASGITSSGATIAWTTNESSDTQVEYGLTTAYGDSTALNSAQVTAHSASLSGLSPNALYHYRVKSRDAAGNLAVSTDFTFTTSPASTIHSYDNPPPLPASSPSTTVNVSTVSQLISALANLQTGWTIRLAAGTYDLNGVTDGLYVPIGVTDWMIRGATGDRDDVVIRGGGMSGNVAYGIWTASARGKIADLTIDGVTTHGIAVNYGAHDLLVHNVRIVDSGDQFVKSNPDGAGNGNDRGVVEYSVFEYRTTDSDNYTNGVDVHSGDAWTVRYNLFKNFLSPTGQGLAGPAVLFWNGSSNAAVEGNTFFNVARGVSLGLIDRSDGTDHSGGLIVNNFFYRDPNLAQEVDVAIFVGDSPNTKILHNTVIASGSYPNAIEYRFSSTTGLEIRNNLTDGGIQARDGASGAVSGNTTNASPNWFVDASAGDLHLLSSAPVIGQAAALAEASIDIDAQSRGSAADVGADEYAAAADSTAPTISSVSSGSLTPGGATITWTTNEPSDTQIEYGRTAGYGSSTTLNTSMVTSHSAAITGLNASTLYHYRVKSRDAAGNLAVSPDFTFTTPAPADTTPPTISAIASGNVTTSGATITWTTNEASNTQVEYGLTTAYGSFTILNSSMVTSHSAAISGLAAGRSYHYRVRSRDAAGNLAVSADFTFTTASPPNRPPVANDNSYGINEDLVLTVNAASGVLWNDSDPEGGTLTVLLVAGPTHGTLVLNTNGSFTYRPVANYHGADSFTYRANDGIATSNIARVSLSVNSVNDPPALTAIEDVAIAMNTTTDAILFSATDVEDAASSLQLRVESSNTALAPLDSIKLSVVGAKRSLTITPVADAVGESIIKVIVSDSANATASKEFRLVVYGDFSCHELPGDTNDDGAIDLDDLNNVRNNFGTSGQGILGDVNCDGAVDLIDMNVVRNAFAATFGLNAAPETHAPGSTLDFDLLAIAMGNARASHDPNRRALVPWQSSAVSDVVFDQLGDHASGILVSDRAPRRSRAWTPFWPTLLR